MPLLDPQSEGLMKEPCEGALASHGVDSGSEGCKFGLHSMEITSLLVTASTSNLVNQPNKGTGNILPMTTMGQRVLNRRKLLGMSQEQLAEFCKVSQQAIDQLEGDLVRRPRYMDDLAIALKTTKNWIKTGIGNPDLVEDPFTPEERRDAEFLRTADPEGWEMVRQLLRREARLARERLEQQSAEKP
ncbi:helix-turn-helix transcriptional regulator (plasmid) [Azospirillum sp. HJ39]|uniref:helix-turn-helix domain-containing protein n=1 Tax=Azospirillum sp. HJ39 TaxID=3159496 RepID=UPI003558877B